MRNRSLVRLLCPALVACWMAVPLAGAVELSEELVYDEAVVRGEIPNGLTYRIRQNTLPQNRLELRLVIRAGSILEDEDQLGLAHFLEHMAFNGTVHFEKQQLVDYLESIGMAFGPDLNAYTSFDETVYMLQIPTDDEEVLENALLILQDWAQGILMDPSEIDKERGVVIEEWRSRRGAAQRIRDEQLKVVFHESRYADRLPIGKVEILETFEPESLRRFYGDWYRPDLMGFVAVGDVPPAELEARIRETFGVLENPPDPRPRAEFEVPDHRETLVSIVDDPEATGSSVSVYYKTPSADLRTHGDYRRYLVEGLFTYMLNQRLDERRKKPNPPFLSAGSFKGSLVLTKDVLGLSASVDDNGFVRGLQEALTEAERVRRFGFTETELERAKAARLRRMEVAYNERETTRSASFAAEYVQDILQDVISPGIEAELALHREFLPAIRLSELNRLAENWITDVNRVIMASGPRKDGVRMPTEEELTDVFARVSEAELEPYVDDTSLAPLVADPPPAGSIAERREIPELGVTEWILSNGMRVLLKPTDFKEDQILFSAFSPGGTSLVDLEELIPTTSAASVMMAGGVGDFSQIQLEKKLADKVAGVTPYMDWMREGLTGSCAPQDLETLCQLVHLWFTAPRADEEAYEAYRERFRASLINRLADPFRIFGDTIRRVMSQDHPRREPWTPEMVDEMDLHASREVFQERFADADDFVVMFVGRFDLEELAPWVELYLASLPSLPDKEWLVDHGVRRPEGPVKREVRKGMDPRSHVVLVFHDLMDWSEAELIRMECMVNALEIRLRERIREDMGGTYGIRVSPQTDRYPEPRYAIQISFGCAPDRVDDLVRAVDEEIARIIEEPLPAQDLTKVRETQLRRREVQLRENEFWRDMLDFYLWTGDDPRNLLRFPELVNEVDGEAIREAAQRYLGTENRAEFRLYPEASAAEGEPETPEPEADVAA